MSSDTTDVDNFLSRTSTIIERLSKYVMFTYITCSLIKLIYVVGQILNSIIRKRRVHTEQDIKRRGVSNNLKSKIINGLQNIKQAVVTLVGDEWVSVDHINRQNWTKSACAA